MLLVGIRYDGRSYPAAAVFIEQTFRHMKKHYRIMTVRPLPDGMEPSDMAAEMERIHLDRKFSARKRLYSQDRRPSKIIRSRPRIILSGTAEGTAAVDALREQKVPVDHMCIDGEKGWHRQRLGKNLGDDYRVSLPALRTAMAAVIAENRLEMAGGMDPVVNDLPTAMAGAATGARHRQVMAMAPPIWFRETIRYTRAYRTA